MPEEELAAQNTERFHVTTGNCLAFFLATLEVLEGITAG